MQKVKLPRGLQASTTLQLLSQSVRALQQFPAQSRGRTTCHRTAQGALQVDQHRHGVKYSETYISQTFVCPAH